MLLTRPLLSSTNGTTVSDDVIRTLSLATGASAAQLQAADIDGDGLISEAELSTLPANHAPAAAGSGVAVPAANSDTDGNSSTSSNGVAATVVAGTTVGLVLMLGCLVAAWHFAGRGVAHRRQPQGPAIPPSSLAINPVFVEPVPGNQSEPHFKKGEDAQQWTESDDSEEEV